MTTNDDFLWRHLQDLPAFRALLRAVEARFYQGLLPLEAPVLDVGCGDGHFASVAFPRALEAGMDPAANTLREAQDRDAYHVLAQALGDALPYPDGFFATVVSNSVLEHIPDVEPVVAEIGRVLSSPGRFIFCVPGDHFTKLLFFTQLAGAQQSGPERHLAQRSGLGAMLLLDDGRLELSQAEQTQWDQPVDPERFEHGLQVHLPVGHAQPLDLEQRIGLAVGARVALR